MIRSRFFLRYSWFFFFLALFSTTASHATEGQGPVVLSSVMTFYDDLVSVNRWNDLPPKATFVNSIAGQWLLCAALAQVDGSSIKAISIGWLTALNMYINPSLCTRPRIGFPTAPHADPDDRFDAPPRVRVNDCVAVIVSITNAAIDGKGNDAFRPLPGLLPGDLQNGFFRIDAADGAGNRPQDSVYDRNVLLDHNDIPHK
jgi:hypothetical protein